MHTRTDSILQNAMGRIPSICLSAAATVLTLLWLVAVFNFLGLYSERIRYTSSDLKYWSVHDLHDIDIGLWKMYNRTAHTSRFVDCNVLSITSCSTICKASQAFSVVAFIGGIVTSILLFGAIQLKRLLHFAEAMSILTALAMVTTVALEMDLGRTHCAGNVNNLDQSPNVVTVSVLEGTYVTACVIWLWILLCLSACINSRSYSGSVSEQTSS